MSEGFSTLRVMRLPGPGSLWKLIAPLEFHGAGWHVVVPAGFISNANSSPWKYSAGEPPGWVHDYLYTSGATWGDGSAVTPNQRSQVDQLFYDALIIGGASKAFAMIQWLAVRLLGASHWQQGALPTEGG